MKRFYLTLCLLAIAVTQCFAGGPAADIYVDALNIADGAVSAIKTDGSLMTSDGSNAVLPDARDNLGLGTMALEDSGDYVATSSYAADQLLKMDTDGSNVLASDTRNNLDVYSKSEVNTLLASYATVQSGILSAGNISITTTGDKFVDGMLMIEGDVYHIASSSLTVDNTGTNTLLTLDEPYEIDMGFMLIGIGLFE